MDIVTSILQSRSYQTGVRYAFSTGDITIISDNRFAAIIEKLLLLASRSGKGILCSQTALTRDLRGLVTLALHSLLSPLPIQFVTGVVETLVRGKADFVVTTHMISIAAERLTRAHSTDISLKSSLTKLLSLLSGVVTSSQNMEEVVVALNCIGKLSRVYGKAELSLFDAVVPSVVTRGIHGEDAVAVENSCTCLLSMLSNTFKA
jgi:hypothetical protein